jgi:hypothetical protein
MMRLAFALAALLVWAIGSPATAQFRVESPADLAMRVNELMPTQTQSQQNALARYVPPTPAEMRDRGKAEAPPLAAAAGLDCKMADARWIGDGQERPHVPKKIFYEIACDGDLGYVLVRTEGAPTEAYTCLETILGGPTGKRADLRCTLPANLDQRRGLVPYVARTGKDCVPDRVRAIGHSPDHTAFELACRDGAGFILLTASPPRLDKPIEIHPCLAWPAAGAVRCQFTDRAAELAHIDALASRAGVPCAPTNRAFIGDSEHDGASFFEVACGAGRGWLLKQGPNLGQIRAVECAEADYVLAGGCRLTDVRVARTQQAALYTTRARAIGLDCEVRAYALLPAREDGSQAVELTCANREAGAIAFFNSAGTGSVIDCAHAPLQGYRCRLSKAQADYPALTADLRALGKTTCVVTGERSVGVTAEHRGYTEVTCADGLQGFMIEYGLDPVRPLSATVCAEARGVGDGCTLAGNSRGQS